ncbi:Beta-adaptin-like protein C [Vitis vinifera]|uniref:Beta-adaptin-like protein n=1 Tax=Vitis vinifera TaxID=29760 RepID=A0A438J551_VITVI|nr:Beta-adaptin-like protein C [Vitis vinifera]
MAKDYGLSAARLLAESNCMFQYLDKRKDAVKKVIAAMTVGKDVSSLFTDVVNCMQTENLELKKLVYLYLINYAKSQPDLAILAVNTFVKDDDPYVRKTASICVAKLYDINAELVEDRGFLESLKDLISDNNPMVVANAVAALSEIQENSSRPIFEVTSHTLSKLLTALNECTELHVIVPILHIYLGFGGVKFSYWMHFPKYKAADAREAESIVERVTPRLQHANCAVVLSAVKMILQQMELITSTDVVRNLCKKMAPPLVTLLSAEPEIQYVALRNINLIVQRRPTILAHEIKGKCLPETVFFFQVFFCKYNDPIYVKMEKLEIMIKLASDRNIDQVLLEFKEYATEVDVDFVRKAVRAIGRCAINYESIIATLCESLDTLDEPEAKSFPEEPAQVQLQLLTATVKLFLKKPTEGPQQMIQWSDPGPVQIALKYDLWPSPNMGRIFIVIGTALPRLRSFKAHVSHCMFSCLQVVLNNATVETDNPDLRDRAYIYWRLLSTDPEVCIG